MVDPSRRFRVEEHRRVRKFFKQHPQLSRLWPKIRAALETDPLPRQGTDLIAHLKANWLCSYRWREGDYRLLYDVFDKVGVVHVFEADSRGQVYRDLR